MFRLRLSRLIVRLCKCSGFKFASSQKYSIKKEAKYLKYSASSYVLASCYSAISWSNSRLTIFTLERNHILNFVTKKNNTGTTIKVRNVAMSKP